MGNHKKHLERRSGHQHGTGSDKLGLENPESWEKSRGSSSPQVEHCLEVCQSGTEASNSCRDWPVSAYPLKDGRQLQGNGVQSQHHCQGSCSEHLDSCRSVLLVHCWRMPGQERSYWL